MTSSNNSTHHKGYKGGGRMLQNLYIFVFNNDLTSNPNMIFPGWMFIQLPINPSKVSQPGL